MRGPVPWLAAPLLLHSTLRPRVGAPPFCQAPPPPKPRLMLVEDQDGLRSAVCKYLQQRGYVVEAFSRVDAAFDAITKGLFPDLIVTDVTMPGLDGYQLLKRVRADPRLCGVPVILLTARGLSDDRIAGYSAGASSYVSKPFEPEELLAVVNAQLTNARLAHDATLTNELQALKQEVAAIKGLLQVLVKQQAQAQLPAAQSPLVSTPAQEGATRQLQAAVRELERGGMLTAPISSDPHGDPGGAEALTARPEPPKLTNRERSVLEP